MIAKRALLGTGWYQRRLDRDVFPGVLVLCYHGVRSDRWRADEPSFPQLHIDAETFDSHCRVLRESCHPISLEDWRAARAGTRALPARPVLVTFDDGYRSVFDVARPILKRHGIPAVVFVCTNPIRDQQLFWFDSDTRRDGETLADDDPLAPMTIDQVRALADEDGFEVGAHTASHVRLGAESGATQREEMAMCRERLQEWTGREIKALAYPFGKPCADYTPETVRIAAELGFDFAFTTRQNFAAADEPPLERSRFLVLSEVSDAELAHRITYSWPR
jgi:peptidoglycan/xylan/chitin deacetylase (PgdA/CDA1 family)